MFHIAVLNISQDSVYSERCPQIEIHLLSRVESPFLSTNVHQSHRQLFGDEVVQGSLLMQKKMTGALLFRAALLSLACQNGKTKW